jgi:hypothetical protein
MDEEDPYQAQVRIQAEVAMEMGLTILCLTNEEANIITPKALQDKITNL